MAAVLGGNEDEVLARFAELELVPANRNAVGRDVGGKVEAIDELVANPPEKARVRKIPLVAGAFHTSFMEPAQEAVAQAAAQITPSDPTFTPAVELRRQAGDRRGRCLAKPVAQVTRPVRWDPVLGHDARCRCHGDRRTAARGHLRRHRQARTQGHAQRGLISRTTWPDLRELDNRNSLSSVQAATMARLPEQRQRRR